MKIGPLKEFSPGDLSGKCRGLHDMQANGIHIPYTVLIHDPSLRETEYHILDQYLELFNSGQVMLVPSVSIAGKPSIQVHAEIYTTTLVDKDKTVIVNAIRKMLVSPGPAIKKVFEEQYKNEGEPVVTIIVQEYIEPLYSGVIYSNDILNNNDQYIILEAYYQSAIRVRDRYNKKTYLYSLQKTKGNLHKQAANNSFIPVPLLENIIDTVVFIEPLYQEQFELYFVIDPAHTLFIVDIRTLRSIEDMFMMPGPRSSARHLYALPLPFEFTQRTLTPLSISWMRDASRALLHGFLAGSGVPGKEIASKQYVDIFYNRTFINISSLYDFSKYVYNTSKDNIEFYALGRVLDTPAVRMEVGAARGWFNFIRQIGYYVSQKKNISRLEAEAAAFKINYHEDADIEDLQKELKMAREKVTELFPLFGALFINTILFHYLILTLLDNKSLLSPANQYQFSVLSVTKKQNSSFQYMRDVFELVDAIVADQNFKNGIIRSSDTDLKLMLNKFAPDHILLLYSRIIARHDFRSTLDFEFQTPSWRTDNTELNKLIRNLVISYKTPDSYHQLFSAEKQKILNRHGWFRKMFLLFFRKKAITSTLRKEKGKNYLLGIFDKSKSLVDRLADKLVEEGVLYHKLNIYYLYAEELDELIAHRRVNHLNYLAFQRKNMFSLFEHLSFPDVQAGSPAPLLFNDADLPAAGSLTGIPASPGTTKGRAKVIINPKDVDTIEPGDILVLKTFFSRIILYYGVCNGVICERGHVLSTGAIAAREAGIPCLLNVDHATAAIENGDTVWIHTEAGRVDIIKQ